MKICFRCKKGIEDSSHHYAFTEVNKETIIKTDYAHKECWDAFLKQLSSLDKAQDFLGRINLGPLERFGLLKPKEVMIT